MCTLAWLTARLWGGAPLQLGAAAQAVCTAGCVLLATLCLALAICAMLRLRTITHKVPAERRNYLRDRWKNTSWSSYNITIEYYKQSVAAPYLSAPAAPFLMTAFFMRLDYLFQPHRITIMGSLLGTCDKWPAKKVSIRCIILHCCSIWHWGEVYKLHLICKFVASSMRSCLLKIIKNYRRRVVRHTLILLVTTTATQATGVLYAQPGERKHAFVVALSAAALTNVRFVHLLYAIQP